jgi:hypothetical protein
MLSRVLLCAAFLAAGQAWAEVTVPLTIEKAIPIAQLTINGATFPFTVDTGSRRTLHLRPEVMAKIPGLKLTGVKKKSFDLAGKVQEDDEFVIPDLVINGVSFGEVIGVAYSEWGLNIGDDAGPPKASVIGLGLFEKQPFVYDYSARELRFGAPLTIGDGWQVQAYELLPEGIVATFANAHARYRMGFDSAASISMVKRASALAQKDETGTCDMFGPGQPCAYVSVALPGGPEFMPFLMDLPDEFKADGIAGSDFFQHYALYADLANHKVALRRDQRQARRGDIDYYLKHYDGADIALARFDCGQPQPQAAWFACYERFAANYAASLPVGRTIPIEVAEAMTDAELASAQALMNQVFVRVAEEATRQAEAAGLSASYASSRQPGLQVQTRPLPDPR